MEDIPYTDMKALNGYRQSANGSRIDKQGIEFQFTSQRISALRTAVVINGAWFRSVYTNSRPMFETVADVVDNRPVSEEYVGLYDWNDGRVNEQFNTNFQLDTQIPEWGLIFFHIGTVHVVCFDSGNVEKWSPGELYGSKRRKVISLYRGVSCRS